MHLGELRAATKLQVAIFRDFYVHTEHAVGSQAPKCLVRRGVSTAQARWSPRLLCYSLCFPASCLLSSRSSAWDPNPPDTHHPHPGRHSFPHSWACISTIILHTAKLIIMISRLTDELNTTFFDSIWASMCSCSARQQRWRCGQGKAWTNQTHSAGNAGLEQRLALCP